MKAISTPKTVLQMLPGTLLPGLFLHPGPEGPGPRVAMVSSLPKSVKDAPTLL